MHPLLLKISRRGARALLRKNERSDTVVKIEGFPEYASKLLLEAIDINPRGMKNLLKEMSTTKGRKKRDIVVRCALRKAYAREKIFEKDLRRTDSELFKESDKINKKRNTGILRKPFVATPKLKALEINRKEQALRLKRAKTYTFMISQWFRHLSWGQIEK